MFTYSSLVYRQCSCGFLCYRPAFVYFRLFNELWVSLQTRVVSVDLRNSIINSIITTFTKHEVVEFTRLKIRGYGG